MSCFDKLSTRIRRRMSKDAVEYHRMSKKMLVRFHTSSSLAFAILLLAGAGCGIHANFSQLTPEAGDTLAVNESSPIPTDQPSAETNLPAQQMPSGVLILSENQKTISLVMPDGTVSATASLTGTHVSNTPSLHLTGSWQEGNHLPPILFHTLVPEQALTLLSYGYAETLCPTQSFLGLAGASGQAAFAYSDVLFEPEGPVSRLFVGTPETICSASPVLDFRDSQMGMALLPVAVDTNGGKPKGVWYIQTTLSIGGVDLVFPINRGLFFFDLSSKENRMMLPLDRNFQGLSPDHTLAASVEFNHHTTSPIRVHFLDTGKFIELPLHSTTERGAGYAVFSADNKYIAWLEVSGSLVDGAEFQPRVRVGNIENGWVVAELDKYAVANALGWKSVSWIKPAGFLDSQSLLIEALREDGGAIAVLNYNPLSKSLLPFSQGSFCGFAFP